jgi:protein TonB
MRHQRGLPVSLLHILSLGAHLGMGLVLLRMEKPEVIPPPPPIRVKTVEIKKPPPPPPPPVPAPEVAPPPKAAPKPRPTPNPASTPPPGPAVPDFGLVLGGAGGPGGVAIPPPRAEGPARTATKELKAPASGGCAEELVKARPVQMPHPTYTESARAAGIEGKVRIELTLDPTGKVENAKVLSGLGHGLDEAAVETVRNATFEPAKQCGKPVASTFTLSVRFTL